LPTYKCFAFAYFADAWNAGSQSTNHRQGELEQLPALLVTVRSDRGTRSHRGQYQPDA